MINLLDFAIAAHGGMERWEKIRSIRLEASITGAIWSIKSRPDVLKNIVADIDTRQEEVVMTFPGQDKTTMFSPRLITVKTDGMVQEHPNPDSSFAGHTLATPWEDVHVAYFSGEALWTYLTTPFLYAYPGFITEELSPWEENGETWRRLKVLFPDTITSHTREQISYFGPDGLLRRHDYTVDILGGATGANYALAYREVGGIIVPTVRKIYAYEDPAHKVVADPLLVSIEMGDISMI